jgi:hypothetical protein
MKAKGRDAGGFLKRAGAVFAGGKLRKNRGWAGFGMAEGWVGFAAKHAAFR